MVPKAPLAKRAAAQTMSSVSIRWDRRGGGETGDLGDAADEAAHQVEGVDALRDQYAAAVAGEAAAAGFVVIALGPPQADDGRAADDAAELARGEDRGGASAGGAEAVLQDHAHLHTGRPAALDQFDGHGRWRCRAASPSTRACPARAQARPMSRWVLAGVKTATASTLSSAKMVSSRSVRGKGNFAPKAARRAALGEKAWTTLDPIGRGRSGLWRAGSRPCRDRRWRYGSCSRRHDPSSEWGRRRRSRTEQSDRPASSRRVCRRPSISTAIIASVNGVIALKVSVWLAPPTRAVVKTSTPSGGVSAPMTRFITMMMPNCTGS